MPQKVFAPGNRWLVAYLAFLSAFAPLSTDMYLPALPHMTQALQTTDALSSLSISCFLLLFGASMLFWGPLSDKYGRKPVLYTGALLYVVSSLFLALAQSIWPLLFWRAVQAVGSGGISAMALAIVKDVLRGRAMEKVITWIQTITILAPMLAPVIGGALLAVTDWRGIFVCLLLCGLLAALAGLTFQQIQKYEHGMNRIGASRLYDFAQILDVPVSFFFAEMPEEVAQRSPRRYSGVSCCESDVPQLPEDPAHSAEIQSLIRAYSRITNREAARALLALSEKMAPLAACIDKKTDMA